MTVLPMVGGLLGPNSAAFRSSAEAEVGRGGEGSSEMLTCRRVLCGPQVEFPEARIYEETLNILLYEAQDGRGPDNALLEATGGAAGRSHHLDEDEERERERIERVRRIHIKRPDDRAHLHQ